MSILFIVLVRFQQKRINTKEKELFREKRLSRRLESIVNNRTADLRRKTEELEQVNSIIKIINKEVDFNTLLYSILDELSIIKGVDKATALVRDKTQGIFRFRASVGWDIQQIQDLQLTEEDIFERYKKHSTQLYEDIFVYDGVKKHWPIKEIGGFQLPQVMLILQITIKDQVEGYFILESMTDPEAFDHKDFEFIKSLQDHIVSAFNKLGLMEELKNTLSNLESAYDQLKELDKYKEAMTAMIVHDFKNSLNTIINFSSSTPSQQRLRSIKNAGQLMLSMVLNLSLIHI